MLIVCDSSGESKDEKYLIIGSLWIPKAILEKHSGVLLGLRCQNCFWGEIKWSKISKDALAFYKEFLRAGIQDWPVEFKAIIVKKNNEAIRKLFDGERSKFSARFHYLLISRHIRKHVSNDLYQIILDSDEKLQKETTELRDFIQKYLSERLPTKKIQNISSATSHILPAIQICDVITGAIGASWNCNLSNTNKASKEIIELLERKFQKKFNVPTSSTETKFNIWFHRPNCNFCKKNIVFETEATLQEIDSKWDYYHESCFKALKR